MLNQMVTHLKADKALTPLFLCITPRKHRIMSSITKAYNNHMPHCLTYNTLFPENQLLAILVHIIHEKYNNSNFLLVICLSKKGWLLYLGDMLYETKYDLPGVPYAHLLSLACHEHFKLLNDNNQPII